MFEVRRRQAIRRAHRPTVLEQPDFGRADVNHRLNSERHSSLQFWSAAPLAVIGDLRFLVHLASNAVPNKFAYNRKTIVARFIFDFGTDIAHTAPFVSGANGARERVFGHTQQVVRALVDNSNGNSCGVISNPTILNDTDVELHYVAILNSPLAADAVDNFVIKRDTNVSGKNAVSEPI